MTHAPQNSEWTAPVLKKGVVSEKTAFAPVGVVDDGALFTS
jgi:hypothetical protein